LVQHNEASTFTEVHWKYQVRIDLLRYQKESLATQIKCKGLHDYGIVPRYDQKPEPLTMLGSLAALGVGAALKRRFRGSPA
jgi:hypothetical protein